MFGARALEREDFGVDIGNTVNMKDKKKMQDIAEIEKKIDQSKVIQGMGSFVTKAVNKAASSNKADLMKSLTASNRLNIGSAKSSSGGFTLSGIKQFIDVKSKTDGAFVQKIANKITTDISNSMKEDISTSSKQLTEDLKKSKEDIKAGTNIGDIANTVGDTVKGLGESFAKILSASVGNNLTNEKEEETLKSLKEKFNLDQSFKQTNKKDVSSDFANALSSENLAKCASEASAKNDMDISKIDVKGDIVISGIQQDALINDAMNCAFNQEVTNEIATKLISNFDNMVKDMIENVDRKLSDTQIAKIQGDIYAAGVAAAMALESAGKAAESAGKGLKDAGAGISEAAKGVGAGASEAAQGVGKGVGTAAEGVGKGVASVASSLTMPLIAAAVLGIVALAIYFLVFKKKSPIGQALEGAITTAAAPASMPLNVAEVMTQKGGLDLLEFINQLSDTPVFRK